MSTDPADRLARFTPAAGPDPAALLFRMGQASAPTRLRWKLGVLALVLTNAAAVGWMAYQATVLDHLTISLVLTAVALLGLAVALRQRSQSSEVHLDRGTLRLRHGDQHHTFYLSSPSTEIAMSGEPGDRDWKVQVLRKGRPPVTIDAKDVDPVAFTATLRHWRPGI